MRLCIQLLLFANLDIVVCPETTPLKQLEIPVLLLVYSSFTYFNNGVTCPNAEQQPLCVYVLKLFHFFLVI